MTPVRRSEAHEWKLMLTQTAVLLKHTLSWLLTVNLTQCVINHLGRLADCQIRVACGQGEVGIT